MFTVFLRMFQENHCNIFKLEILKRLIVHLADTKFKIGNGFKFKQKHYHLVNSFFD